MGDWYNFINDYVINHQYAIYQHSLHGNNVITTSDVDPATVPTDKSAQFTVDGEYYFNKTSEYDNNIYGCLPGTYTITPDTPGSIKIMIEKQQRLEN